MQNHIMIQLIEKTHQSTRCREHQTLTEQMGANDPNKDHQHLVDSSEQHLMIISMISEGRKRRVKHKMSQLKKVWVLIPTQKPNQGPKPGWPEIQKWLWPIRHRVQTIKIRDWQVFLLDACFAVRTAFPKSLKVIWIVVVRPLYITENCTGIPKRTVSDRESDVTMYRHVHWQYVAENINRACLN